MKRLLVMAEIPAPYRLDVFKKLSLEYKITVFIEMNQDGNRDERWLKNQGIEYEILEGNKSAINHWKKCIKNLKHFDGVILYNNTLKYAMITEVLCILNRIPFFINCDGCFNIETKNPIKKIIKNFFMGNATACFAGGKTAKQYFQYYNARDENIFVHNFTSLHEDEIIKKIPSQDEKKNLRKELGLKEEKIILSVGRFIEVKGFDVLIRSCKNLESDIGIYIIGGKPTDEYIELKEKYNLTNVHFIDFKDKKELKKYYLASDLFVLMSRGDTWGLVINEAMANGLPVITTDKCVAGIELIDNDINGYVIPVDNEEILIEKINVILEDNKIKESMSMNSLKKIKEYTIENVSKKHVDVINNYI